MLKVRNFMNFKFLGGVFFLFFLCPSFGECMESEEEIQIVLSPKTIPSSEEGSKKTSPPPQKQEETLDLIFDTDLKKSISIEESKKMGVLSYKKLRERYKIKKWSFVTHKSLLKRYAEDPNNTDESFARSYGYVYSPEKGSKEEILDLIFDQDLDQWVSIEESKKTGVLSYKKLREHYKIKKWSFVTHKSLLKRYASDISNPDESLARVYQYDENSLQESFGGVESLNQRILRVGFALGLMSILYTEGDKIITYWGGSKIIEPLERKIQEFFSWFERLFFVAEEKENKELSLFSQVSSKVLTLGTVFSFSYGVIILGEAFWGCLKEIIQ